LQQSFQNLILAFLVELEVMLPVNREIHLCQSDRYPVDPGNSGIAFYCDDIDTVYQKLKSRGVKFSKELTKAPWGSFAMLQDPDGNKIWLQPDEP
jgi:predicted enzyme related to lactoylglutathione lyase